MEYRIKVKKWMTIKEDNPIPMRVMFGKILRETQKAIYVSVYGKPEPSTTCLHCGRKLTHPVSLLFGIGPICGGHYHINPLNSEEELQERIEEIKQKLADVKWEGWIPKSQIVEMTEVKEEKEEKVELKKEFLVIFKYEGKVYKTITDNKKLQKIRENSEIIELEKIS